MRIMATDNKNSKKTEPVAASAVRFPVLRNGAWECSDGFRTQDAYVAGQHEKKLKKQ